MPVRMGFMPAVRVPAAKSPRMHTFSD